MNSHELAYVLLSLPNLPVATHADNHTYMSKIDTITHGCLKVCLLETYVGQHIVIGNVNKVDLNSPNWYVSQMLYPDK